MAYARTTKSPVLTLGMLLPVSYAECFGAKGLRGSKQGTGLRNSYTLAGTVIGCTATRPAMHGPVLDLLWLQGYDAMRCAYERLRRYRFDRWCYAVAVRVRYWPTHCSGLRGTCYALSGTGLRTRYALSGTGLRTRYALSGSALRTCYALSSTGVASHYHRATADHFTRGGTEIGGDRPGPCAGWRTGAVLSRYAMPGTDIAYAPMGCPVLAHAARGAMLSPVLRYPSRPYNHYRGCRPTHVLCELRGQTARWDEIRGGSVSLARYGCPMQCPVRQYPTWTRDAGRTRSSGHGIADSGLAAAMMTQLLRCQSTSELNLKPGSASERPPSPGRDQAALPLRLSPGPPFHQ
eukprot:1042760-Rhodomonas_salina.2